MEVVKKFPTLYRPVPGGGFDFADIRVERGASCPRIVTFRGREGSAGEVASRDVDYGKNRGKKNATTPEEQALFEAESEWDKLRDRKGYSEIREPAVPADPRRPMRPLPYAPYAKAVEWRSAVRAQPNLGGIRCLTHVSPLGSVHFSTPEFTGKFPTITAELKGFADECRTVKFDLDGEFYCPGMRPEELADAVASESVRVGYWVADAPAFQAFDARNRVVRAMFADWSFDRVHEVDTVKVGGEDELEVYQSICLAKGYDGAAVRHGPSGYEADRASKSFLLADTFRSGQFPVVDVRSPSGTRTSALVCQLPDGESFEAAVPAWFFASGRISQLDELLDLLVTVRYAGFSQSDRPIPRLPVVVAVEDP